MSVGRKLSFFALIIGVLLSGPLWATADEEMREQSSWRERDTLTAGWFGGGERLAAQGFTMSLGLTHIFQKNVCGGLDTSGQQNYSGSYDLEIEADLEKLLGIDGASLYVLTEGSWNKGIDESAVGSLLGVNADAGGNRTADVTELRYEQWFSEGRVGVRAGKLNLTGGFECRGCPVTFDGNTFANDETGQFLNDSLVNNPAIPFPDNGLGVILYTQPTEWWYHGLGVADAEADARESGFNTTFDGDGDFFYIYETGITPQIASERGALQGAYRVGVWLDNRPKEHLTGDDTTHGDVGFYLSLDQMVWKEKAGVFARFGHADEDVNEITNFWSVGGQYQGLFPGRDGDVLGIGCAQACLSDDAGFSASHERVVEVYYSAQVTGWMNLTPSVQHIHNPGGDEDVDDAVVVGLRMQMAI